MSDIIWKLGNDGQNAPYNDLFSALKTGVILGGTATSFSMKDGPAVVIFHGSFTVINGTITAGTISSFQVFHNSAANKLMDVSGYSANFQAFKQAVTQYNQGDGFPIAHLLLNPPMTVHGANQVGVAELVLGGFRGDHVNGNGGRDFIQDQGGSDFIYGGAGDDQIDDDFMDLGGIAGHDFLSGGEGNDVIRARGGNDFMSGGNGQDELDGGEGSDTADYSEKLNAVTLALNGPNDVKVLVDGVVEDTIRNTENANGGGGGDRLAGDGFNNAFAGNAGDDKITGNLGNDDLSGGDGNDKLDGGDGNDRIAGGLGNDRLVGGKTSDTLVFDAALHAKNNVDKVKKFSHAKDTVELDQAVFTELDLGALKGKHFHLGETAKDGNDRIIYDEASGVLAYDADGRGGLKQVSFAKLKGAPEIAPDDFLVV